MSMGNINPDMQEQAHSWFARLTSSQCTNADREAFERWRAKPEHALAYIETQQLWHMLGQIADRPGMERLSTRVWAETAFSSRGFSKRKIFLAAAASVAVAALGGLLYLGIAYYASARTYATETGQRSTFTLTDGSQVTLNASTRLDVKIDKERRQFTLHRGEALFVVAEDRLRPFTVFAGDSQVRALGTRFTVRREAVRTTVTLLEGKVAVDRAGDNTSVQLTPGEQVRILPAAPQVVRRRVDPDLAASWTVGRLKFRSTPLSEVLDEVNRYAKTPIILGDRAMADTPVSGTFQIGDSDSMAAALQALLPLNLERRERGEIVLVRQ